MLKTIILNYLFSLSHDSIRSKRKRVINKKDRRSSSGINLSACNEWRWIFDRTDAVIYLKSNRIIDYKSETIKWLVEQKVRQWVIIQRIGYYCWTLDMSALSDSSGRWPHCLYHLFMRSSWSWLNINLLTMKDIWDKSIASSICRSMSTILLWRQVLLPN